MTSKEFIIWFKGYSDAIITTPTQAQWDDLKKVVSEVKDEPTSPFPMFTPNTTPMPLPYYPNPIDNPYRVTCSPGTTGTGTTQGVITTTPGGGSVTYATPQFVTSTSTAYGYPSGSTLNYTNK